MGLDWGFVNVTGGVDWVRGEQILETPSSTSRLAEALTERRAAFNGGGNYGLQTRAVPTIG